MHIVLQVHMTGGALGILWYALASSPEFVTELYGAQETSHRMHARRSCPWLACSHGGLMKVLLLLACARRR